MALVGGQVLFPQIAAGLSGIAVDGVGNGSPVEGFAVGPSKLLQSFGHALILKDLTGSGSAAADGEIRCPGLVKFWGELFFKGLGQTVPECGYHGRYGEAVPGIGGGRLQDLGEGQLSKAFVDLRPAGGDAGDCNGSPAVFGHFCVSGLF